MHDCPKPGCHEQVSFEQLACPKHWFSLPPNLRRQINAAWREGNIEKTLTLRKQAVAVWSAE